MVTNENILNIIIVATDSPSLVVQQGPLARQLSRMIQVWMRRGGNIIVGRMHLNDTVTPGGGGEVLVVCALGPDNRQSEAGVSAARCSRHCNVATPPHTVA